MLVIFAVIVGGIITGRLLSSRRLAFVPHFITVIIWALLFFLGIEVGTNPAVVSNMAALGSAALVICLFAVAGSICASWLLWRYIRRRNVVKEIQAASASPVGDSDCATSVSTPRSVTEGETPIWDALKGSLVIIGFFVAGCLTGLFVPLPFDISASHATTYVLYGLMFFVGITLGHDATLVTRMRRLDPRLLLLPLMTIIGTLAGAALSAPLLSPMAATDALAIGSGFGYYSLSSIFIADFRGLELGTVALLCNVMREIFTLLTAPLVARWFGPLAAVSMGGVTSLDVTLPVITRAAGKQYAIVSIYHGATLEFCIPFLVTFFCTI
ncbi:lysine exporter LysO family protein [uncultured Alistipes sp.]|jgi:hypothetical protein|uniref:lysine exporter LysO family protein n=1 Tax=uncultured Alistipes sp. TaxID=538949 RepID=UPI0025D43499|nr:lysine exporter LysO family protein [uncultured Alistipes sp.]